MSKEYLSESKKIMDELDRRFSTFEKCIVCGEPIANGPDTPDQAVLRARVEHMKIHGVDFSYLLERVKP